jgi:hypothetical protein
MVIVNALIRTSAYFMHIQAPPDTPSFGGVLANLLLISVVIPFIETVFLTPILIIGIKIIKNINITSTIAALIIGITHSKPIWPYFIIYTIMFYFFSIFYLTRLKISFTNGFIAGFLPHLLNNSILALGAFIDA